MKRFERRGLARLSVLGFLIVLIGVSHFVVNPTSHEWHVVLRSLFVVPIIGGAIWFRLRGALLAALAVSLIYGTHVMLDWSGTPMENTSQAAMIAMYLVIGGVAGGLSSLEEKQRVARESVEKRMQRDMFISGLQTLSRALEWRDSSTQRHSESVAALGVAVAQKMRMTADQVERVHFAARVHDIGKIGVGDDVLLKQGELSHEERKVIEQHPEVAADLLQAIPGTADLASIVMAHHECPDGTGYPHRLTSEQIPPEAAVLKVADVYCALTEDRPYRRGVGLEAALIVMERMRGSKLDSPALTALGAVLQEGTSSDAEGGPET